MNGVDLMVLVPIIAVIMALGLPIVVMVMFFISVMKKDRQKKEIRQMIIENNVDPETEAAMLAKNQIKYEGLLNSINSEFSNLRTVMK